MLEAHNLFQTSHERSTKHGIGKTTAEYRQIELLCLPTLTAVNPPREKD